MTSAFVALNWPSGKLSLVKRGAEDCNQLWAGLELRKLQVNCQEHRVVTTDRGGKLGNLCEPGISERTEITKSLFSVLCISIGTGTYLAAWCQLWGLEKVF